MVKIIKIREKYANIITKVKVMADIDIYAETLPNPNYKDEYKSIPIEYRVCETLDMVTFKINKNIFNISQQIFGKSNYPKGHINRKDNQYNYLSVDYIDLDVVILRLEQAKLVKLISRIQPRDKEKKWEGNILPIYLNPIGLFQNIYSIIYIICQVLYETIIDLKEKIIKKREVNKNA